MDCLVSNAFLRYQTECPVCSFSILFLLRETKSDASAHFTSLNLTDVHFSRSFKVLYRFSFSDVFLVCTSIPVTFTALSNH